MSHDALAAQQCGLSCSALWSGCWPSSGEFSGKVRASKSSSRQAFPSAKRAGVILITRHCHPVPFTRQCPNFSLGEDLQIAWVQRLNRPQFGMEICQGSWSAGQCFALIHCIEVYGKLHPNAIQPLRGGAEVLGNCEANTITPSRTLLNAELQT